MPKGNAGNGPHYKLAMKAVKEFGELMSTSERALDDGRISQQERTRLEREGYQAIQAIVSFLESVKVG